MPAAGGRSRRASKKASPAVARCAPPSCAQRSRSKVWRGCRESNTNNGRANSSRSQASSCAASSRPA
eukprot:4414500-Alexandrium_andersonii.AAC.1